jgi:hypothetical protein
MPIQPMPGTAPVEQTTRPVRDPNIQATTIRLPVAVLTALKSPAVERRVPTKDLLVEAMEDFVRLHGRKEA